MNSEVDTLEDNILTEEEADNTITHLRTDDGSLRYPISITDAIYMDNQEQVNLTQYLQDMGTSTLFAKQILATQFTQDSDGYYTYQIQNPFDTNKVICNMRNTAGENLVCACTITVDMVEVTLVEPEDCWVLLTGDNIGQVVIDGGMGGESHSHTNKVTLDRLDNLDGRITYGGNALAYESLIGDLSKINGTNIVDILLKMCEMLDLDLGEPDAPEMPSMDPVLSSTTSAVITNRLDNEIIIIKYSFNSDTATNTLHIFIDDVENTKAVTNTSGSLSVGPLAAGSHTVILIVEDTNGNLSNELTFAITVIEHEEEPEIPNPELQTSSSSKLTFNEGETITIEYSYSSTTNDNILYYGVEGGQPTSIQMSDMEGSGSLLVGPFEPGMYTFFMYVVDGNSNSSKEIEIELTVEEVVAPEPAGLDSIIINQFYSSGGKDDGALTHSFIELYNTSDEDINIYNLYIHYAGGEKDQLKKLWQSFALSASHKADGTTQTLILPGHTSFLILMKSDVSVGNADHNLADVTLYGKNYNFTECADMFFTRWTMSNKYAKVVLSSSSKIPSKTNPLECVDEGIIDCIIAANTDSLHQIEAGLYDNCVQGLSKSWAVRRVNFAKTGLSSVEDFEVIYYKAAAHAIFLPRSMEVGPWTSLGVLEGDDMFETNGISVTKLFISEDQLQYLVDNPTSTVTGEFWHYNAETGLRTVNGYMEIKYQHYSGAPGRKENYTIDLYSDEDLLTKLDTKFKRETFSKQGWPKLNKLVLKGNRKDPSHAHNLVTSNIIRQSYKENHILPDKDAEVYGMIDGFPTVLYINDEKQGIYTLNMPQHRKVYGIEKGDTTSCIFRGKSDGGVVSDTVRFKALCEFTDDQHNEWEDRYPKAYEDETMVYVGEANKANLNRLITYVMNTPEAEFYNQLDKYMDIDYLIDYFIWMYFGGFTDSAANNFNIFTYDGKVFIPTFYDMDATFGLNHEGTEMLPTDVELFTNYRTTDSQLWDKLFGSGADADIVERYRELRETTMNKEFILSEFDRFWAMIPAEEQAFDEQKWASPLMGTDRLATHRQQMEEWLTARETWCDAQLLGSN